MLILSNIIKRSWEMRRNDITSQTSWRTLLQHRTAWLNIKKLNLKKKSTIPVYGLFLQNCHEFKEKEKDNLYFSNFTQEYSDMWKTLLKLRSIPLKKWQWKNMNDMKKIWWMLSWKKLKGGKKASKVFKLFAKTEQKVLKEFKKKTDAEIVKHLGNLRENLR